MDAEEQDTQYCKLWPNYCR